MPSASAAKSRRRLPQKRKRGGEDWKAPALAADQVYLYGLHTVRAAIENPERKNVKLTVTQNALTRLEIDAGQLGIPVEIVSPQDIDKVLGPDAIHQGVMLETRPLPVRRLEALKDSPLLLVLDQVTDPHNVGAIMRSAVAFNAGAVITTQRHSPTESGVLAKSASGALELIPYIQITNLADALGELHRLGFFSIGLDFGRTGADRRHVLRRQGCARPRFRRQGSQAEDARDRQRACAARHAGRDQIAERLECGCDRDVCRTPSSEEISGRLKMNEWWA